jgi:hypothetical protein
LKFCNLKKKQQNNINHKKNINVKENQVKSRHDLRSVAESRAQLETRQSNRSRIPLESEKTFALTLKDYTMNDSTAELSPSKGRLSNLVDFMSKVDHHIPLASDLFIEDTLSPNSNKNKLN